MRKLYRLESLNFDHTYQVHPILAGATSFWITFFWCLKLKVGNVVTLCFGTLKE